MSIDIERIKADAAAEEAQANAPLAYDLACRQGRPAAEVLATLQAFAAEGDAPASMRAGQRLPSA